MPKPIIVKSVLNKTKRRDTWFLDDYTLNPYSGCSFNCLFCYIRGSKYGTHMEEKLSVKQNALEVLDKQLYLRAKKNQHGVIVLASATEPYLQFEPETKITRGMLELILKYRFPVHVLTRSHLVTRDFDLLHEIDKQAIIPESIKPQINRGVFLTFSFSTLEDSIAKIFEPGATPPTQRLATLMLALREGFHSGVSLMPMLPYITDTKESLDKIFETFQQAGVKYLFSSTLTLFGDELADSKTMVLRAVKNYFPHLLEKYKQFFDQSGYMPAYYTEAYKKKIKELSVTYGIKNQI